ncbi:hypothetical protein B0T10DRAFT_473312 [Thelonectria olida]|uniref:Uncharacterized protein n=1 Tax=Thelonectria olida TaxID=1576542 RepID=A0A9P8WFR1_9HYPO|nr:hypothetical protein B0T10DRAFT_473312 [Thelonectria olida]
MLLPGVVLILDLNQSLSTPLPTIIFSANIGFTLILELVTPLESHHKPSALHSKIPVGIQMETNRHPRKLSDQACHVGLLCLEDLILLPLSV